MFVVEDCYMVIERQITELSQTVTHRIYKFALLKFNLSKESAISFADNYIADKLRDTGNDVSDNIYIVKHNQF